MSRRTLTWPLLSMLLLGLLLFGVRRSRQTEEQPVSDGPVGRGAPADSGGRDAGEVALVGRGDVPAPYRDPYFESEDEPEDEPEPDPGGAEDARPVGRDEVLVRVLGQDGRPVPEGAFELWSVPPGWGFGVNRHGVRRGHRTGTFRAGAIRFPRDLLRGVTSLTIRPEGPRWLGVALVDLDPAAFPAEVRLRAAVVLAGRTLTADGTPVEGVRVEAAPLDAQAGLGPQPFGGQHTYSDAEGVFRLPVPPRMRVRIRATSPRLDHPVVEAEAQADEAQAGEADLTLVMPPMVALRLTVLTPDGQPAWRAAVNVWLSGRQRARVFPRRVRLNAEGWIWLMRLPPDKPVVLTVVAPTPRLPFLAPPALEVLPGVGEVTLRLQPGLRIAGRLRWPADGPAPRAKVSAVRVPTGERFRGRVAADGSFEVAGLARGPYRIEVEAGADYVAVKRDAVEAPSEGLQIILPRAFVLRLPLVGRSGDGLVAYWIGAREARHASVRGREVVLPRLPDEPGLLYLGRRGNPWYGLRRIASPRQGGGALRLRRGAVIRGRVDSGRLEDEGAGDRSVVNRRATQIVVVGADFELPLPLDWRASFATFGLPPGAYVLELRDPMTGAVVDRVTGVRPGAEDVVLRWR